jgi:hypothetical protein
MGVSSKLFFFTGLSLPLPRWFMFFGAPVMGLAPVLQFFLTVMVVGPADTFNSIGLYLPGSDSFFSSFRAYVSFFLPDYSFYFLANPSSDLDPSASTDSDDLVVFVADIFEFAEHEQAFVLDSLGEFFCGGVAFFCGAGVYALSIRALKG